MVKRLGSIFLALVVCLAVGTGARAQWDTRADSTGIWDGSVPGSKLTNPLRYTGNVGITGTLGVGRGTLPNAKTVMSIYPAVGAADTLQSWRRSSGFPVAWVDSLGKMNSYYFNAAGVSSFGSWNVDANGTASSPAMLRGSATKAGIYFLNGYGSGIGIAAKGAQVAQFDSTGVNVTGKVKLSTLFHMTPLAAQPDTTGMTGGEMWYTTGDSLYIYKADKTIGVIFP